MNALLGFLTLALFMGLIIGLIKPSLILRWSKKPTRFKVFGLWLIGISAMGIVAVSTADEDKIAKSNIESALKYIDEGKYENAIRDLNKIQEDNPLYQEAQILLYETDSLSKLTEEEILLAKQVEIAKAKNEKKIKQKEQLSG